MPLLKALTALALALPRVLPAASLTAHEWGTFTSVAGQDGNPVRWATLAGAPDLPCFVERLSPHAVKLAPALVRMETPVMYFYAPRAITLSVRVNFPQGWITEWYPHATSAEPKSLGVGLSGGQVRWDSVQVAPVENPQFPSIQGHSRYFAARNTDATPLTIAGEPEKFIFYRGVGDLSVPLRPTFTSSGKLEIRNAGPTAIPVAIIFENRDGRMGFRVVSGVKDSVQLDAPELTSSPANIRQRLADSLLEFGLYKKEAAAMLDTWQDSWFEEGMRVFYVVPREEVDAALPLEITPTPKTTTRVFVGRVEILSPWMQQSILAALRTGNIPTLAKFGRFLEPFLNQLQQSGALVESPSATLYLQQARLKMAAEFNSASCVR